MLPLSIFVVIFCQRTPTPIQNIAFLGAFVKESLSVGEREGARRGIGSRAVPPPALEFLVERTPVIVAVDGDTAVVGHVVIHKRKDTGAVNKVNARPIALRMRHSIEVAHDVLLDPVSRKTSSLAWCPLCSGHVRCPEGAIAFPALGLYRDDLGFACLASSYVQPK